jgi:hypothetical protein
VLNDQWPIREKPVFVPARDRLTLAGDPLARTQLSIIGSDGRYRPCRTSDCLLDVRLWRFPGVDDLLEIRHDGLTPALTSDRIRSRTQSQCRANGQCECKL